MMVFQVYVQELNVRDFDADANRVRDWVNQMGYPENVRIECNANATEELKSTVSAMNSGSASRAETPLEEIPRTPSPKLLPAQSLQRENGNPKSQTESKSPEETLSQAKENMADMTEQNATEKVPSQKGSLLTPNESKMAENIQPPPSRGNDN